MYEKALPLLAVLSCLAGAYALQMRRRLHQLERRMRARERRETALLEVVRQLVAASRRSKEAVLESLYRALRSFDPAIDGSTDPRYAGPPTACQASRYAA